MIPPTFLEKIIPIEKPFVCKFTMKLYCYSFKKWNESCGYTSKHAVSAKSDHYWGVVLGRVITKQETTTYHENTLVFVEGQLCIIPRVYIGDEEWSLSS